MNINNLYFKFHKNDDHYFFNNIQMQLSPGTLYVVQGENGVGKSTLFSILHGGADPESFLRASVQVDDVSTLDIVDQFPESFTRQVHLVEQKYDTMLAQECSFLENLKLASMPRYPGLAPLANPQLFPIIEKLGINLSQQVSRLSGGQRQLLAILMALQKPTRLLLLDEPTATLDRINSRMIMDFLLQLAEELNLIVMIICHDKELIDEYPKSVTMQLVRQRTGERTFTMKNAS